MLELLVSGPGTGKTSYCLELFRNEISKSKGGIDSRSFFVLPSREHAERIQNLLLRKDVPGLFNAHIVTINDLAERLLELPAVSQPSDAERQSLVRGILEGPVPLPFFDASKDLPGFHKLLAELIKEFKTCLLSVAEFEKRAQPLLKSPVFRAKFRDFSVLVKNYEKRLAASGLSEPEDVIAELVSARLAPGCVDLVVLDGFYHFTRAQNELIRALSRVSRDVVATLTISGRPGERPELFYYPERTRAFLLSAGFRERAAEFSVNHRAKNAALASLEQELFSKKPVSEKTEPNGITVFEASNVRGEIEMIAREIRRISREETLYLSDICVLLRSVSPYQNVIASTFERFGIPVHIHERYKLKETPGAAFLYRFLRLCSGEWMREDLFYLLKSGRYGERVRLEDVLAFERDAAADNIVSGRAGWLALSAKRTPGVVHAVLKEWAEAEKAIFSATDTFDFAEAIGGLLRASGVAASPADRAIDELLKRSARPVRRPSRVVFDAAAAAAELSGRIESGLYSVKPRGKNRVQVYDVVMALPKEFKVVFVAGLVERVFPQAINEDALFKDDERREMNKKDIILEERAWRAAGERYFFYMALSRTREKLYLSYPLYDERDRPCQPSFFVEEVRRCFQKEVPTRTKRLNESLPAPGEWETDAEALRGLAEHASDATARKAMRGWFERPELRDVMKWASGGDCDAGIEDPRVVAALASENGPFSATRLEKFSVCAFKYFAGETLKLNEPLEGRENIDMGVLLHKALEDYYRSLPAAARRSGEHLSDRTRLQKALFAKLDDAFADKKLHRLHREPVYRQKICLDSMRKALALFAGHERILFEQRGLVPEHFELSFGDGRKGSPGCLEIADGNTPIRLRGQIDRVDLVPGGRGALVVDYKRSKRDLSISAKLEQGLEFQLPVYILAAEKFLKLSVIGAEHRILRTAEVSGLYRELAGELFKIKASKGILSDDAFDAVLKDAEGRIRQAVRRIRSGDIRPRSKSCDWCSFGPVCRFESWRLIYAEKPE